METNLSAPIKQFLESLGYHVKGEIGGCDLVGVAEGSPPVVVIGELKLAFNPKFWRRNGDEPGISTR
jgi:hypothetical protein